jgi:hypothetical protein
MVSFRQHNGFTMRPRLRRLQDVQTEIYRQLQLLIPDQAAFYDSFRSEVPGSPVLRMDILERHPYTDFLRLTYQFEQGETVEVAPDAHIRVYNDARLAEATSFDPQQGFKRDAHPWYPQNYLFHRSWRQNRTLDKWLGYLLHQGHSVKSMRPAGDKIA